MRSEPAKIELLTSLCERNAYYLVRIEKIVERFCLNCTVTRITDPQYIRKKGITVNCFDLYCPGCITMHGSLDGEQCAPALMINDQIVCCNYPPDDGELEKILLDMCRP